MYVEKLKNTEGQSAMRVQWCTAGYKERLVLNYLGSSRRAWVYLSRPGSDCSCDSGRLCRVRKDSLAAEVNVEKAST